MLWALDLSSGDFGAFPHKQRPSILSAGRERTSMNRISILKKEKKKEKKKGRVGRRPALKGRGTDDAVATMFLQQYCRNALSSVSGYRPSQANSQEWGNSAEVRGEDPGRILT